MASMGERGTSSLQLSASLCEVVEAAGAKLTSPEGRRYSREYSASLHCFLVVGSGYHHRPVLLVFRPDTYYACIFRLKGYSV